MSYPKLFKKLEVQKNWFEDHFSSDQFEGSWNSSEIVNHFISIEKAGIANFNSYSEKSKKLGFRESMNSFVLNTALRLPLKYIAPKRLSDLKSDDTKEELLLKWNKVRNELTNIITSYSSNKKNYSFFNHPKSGLMNFSNYLKFLYLHHNHHKNQFLKK